ncbi:hypothetical protein C3K47_10055 [Solitalea longa]|uniref:Acetate uptake transporter n=1 Tax=Solitalea longa TaxID=2079460 RepID=A0A2S5A281_9SPHI|nr:GPR1/FUN34/YaaH family transporter [Solitalea longa]POY36700.1 hypothetical protein C3K47_10055 [Solitalea longa]
MKTSNPGPLGLFGFATTTILLNLHNVGLINKSSVILAMAVALGGLAQIIAGIFEFKKENTFGATAFSAYGLFWFSLLLIWINPFKGIVDASKTDMGWYLTLWAMFTFVMFIGALKHDVATRIVFGSLTFLFVLLALADFTNDESITHIAGIVGIFVGCSAFYSASAQIINGEFGREIVPRGGTKPNV